MVSAAGNGAGLTASGSGLDEVHGLAVSGRPAPVTAASGAQPHRLPLVASWGCVAPETVIFPKRMAPSAVMAGAIRKLPSQRILTALFQGSVATVVLGTS